AVGDNHKWMMVRAPSLSGSTSDGVSELECYLREFAQWAILEKPEYFEKAYQDALNDPGVKAAGEAVVEQYKIEPSKDTEYKSKYTFWGTRAGSGGNRQNIFLVPTAAFLRFWSIVVGMAFEGGVLKLFIPCKTIGLKVSPFPGVANTERLNEGRSARVVMEMKLIQWKSLLNGNYV